MDKAPYIFTLKEICEMLIKKADITEGYWAAVVEFQMGATFAAADGGLPIPTAMVGVSRIGLQPVDAEHPQAVNAGTAPSTAKRPRTAKKVAKAA